MSVISFIDWKSPSKRSNTDKTKSLYDPCRQSTNFVYRLLFRLKFCSFIWFVRQSVSTKLFATYLRYHGDYTDSSCHSLELCESTMDAFHEQLGLQWRCRAIWWSAEQTTPFLFEQYCHWIQEHGYDGCKDTIDKIVEYKLKTDLNNTNSKSCIDTCLHLM